MRSSQPAAESVLDRAFKILDVLGAANAPLGLSEVATRTGIPKATVYRLLNQLADLDAIERRGEWYLLGGHLFSLGAAVAVQRRLREVALPLMAELCDSLRRVVHLGVLDHGAVLHIEKAVPRRHHGSLASLGSRRPLHATALGKAILASLPAAVVADYLDGELKRFTPLTVTNHAALTRQLARARGVGFATESEEWVLGVNCVAAPILNTAAPAGISVTGPTSSFDPAKAADAVMVAANEISRELKNGRSLEFGVRGMTVGTFSRPVIIDGTERSLHPAVN